MNYDKVRYNKTLPALKHGGYAATIVLPGENAAEFQRLHGELIAELAPNGALEEDIVATMAGLVWRKRHLGTLRIAQLARSRFEEISSDKFHELPPSVVIKTMGHIDPAIKEKTIRAVEEQAQTELGDAYVLAEIGTTASFRQLVNELEVQEQLDAMIDKCLKRLLFLRGVKSLAPASSPARIAAPAITP
jgi:hypothetical protein